ncbi:MAG: cytochrome c biogenesis protein CcdA [Nitrospiraceae bacterium]|nr:cytochrome c biogenesis protein CcdA [Nitrospirota bacterium]MDA8337888.1 cytochrome c biogenesis protein CcdA [Nitrospiraceae bacterium]
MENVSLIMAFGGGLLSFFSPCVLPVIPSYVSYITGISFEDLTGEQDKGRIRKVTLKNSLSFIAGFSLIFILLGASSSFLGSILSDYQDTVRKIGGVLIVVMGLYIAGILKIGFLMQDKRLHLQNKPAGLLGSFFVGTAFAAGWTPCIGPILGSILLYASTANSVTSGIELLTAYALGLGIPFLITSLAINTALSYFKKINRYMRVVSVVSGLFLVVVGILLFTGTFNVLSQYMTMISI